MTSPISGTGSGDFLNSIPGTPPQQGAPPIDTIALSQQIAAELQAQIAAYPALATYLSTLSEANQQQLEALNGAAQAIASTMIAIQSRNSYESALATQNVQQQFIADNYSTLLPDLNKLYDDMESFKNDYNSYVTGDRNTVPSLLNTLGPYTDMLFALQRNLRDVSGTSTSVLLDTNTISNGGLNVNDLLQDYLLGQTNYDAMWNELFSSRQFDSNNPSDPLAYTSLLTPLPDYINTQNYLPPAIYTTQLGPYNSMLNDYPSPMTANSLIPNGEAAIFTALMPFFNSSDPYTSLGNFLANFNNNAALNAQVQVQDGKVYVTFPDQNNFQTRYNYDDLTFDLPDISYQNNPDFTVDPQAWALNSLLSLLNTSQTISPTQPGSAALYIRQFHELINSLIANGDGASYDVNQLLSTINNKFDEFQTRLGDISQQISDLNARGHDLSQGKEIPFPTLTFGSTTSPMMSHFDFQMPDIPQLKMSLVGFSGRSSSLDDFVAPEPIWALYPSSYEMLQGNPESYWDQMFQRSATDMAIIPTKTDILGVVQSDTSTGAAITGLMEFLNTLLMGSLIRKISKMSSESSTAPNEQLSILPKAFVDMQGTTPQTGQAFGPGSGVGYLSSAAGIKSKGLTELIYKAMSTVEVQKQINPNITQTGDLVNDVKALADFYLNQSVNLSAGGAISLLGNQSGDFNERSPAVPIALSLKLTELLSADYLKENLSNNIKSLLESTFASLPQDQLAALTSLLTELTRFNLLSIAINQLGQSAGIPDLLKQILASTPNSETFKTPIEQAQANTLNDVLQNKFSIATSIEDLQKLVEDNQKEAVKQAILAIAGRTDITNEIDLREALRQELAKASQNTIDKPTFNAILDRAVTFLSAERQGGYVLDTLAKEEQTDPLQISQGLQAQGLTQTTSDKVAQEAAQNLNTIQYDTDHFAPVSQRIARDEIATQLAKNGFLPNNALLIATQTIVGNQNQPLPFQSISPAQLALNIGNKVAEKLSGIDKNQAAEIQQQVTSTVIQTQQIVSNQIALITKVQDGKFTDTLNTSVKEAIKYNSDSALINFQIFSQGKVALGIMSDHHPKGNINQGVSGLAKQSIDIHV